MAIEHIRNIGIIAHIDAGKTTTTERILYYAGKIHQMGEVDEGTTTTDYDPEEQERGITITAATVQVRWRDCQINIIDTPGHVDFTAEVERSLRVLDGAVVVFDGVAGVQAQSETVWRQADRYRVPRLAFINKLDRTGADFDRSVASIADRLGAVPLPLQLPLGHEAAFTGSVDLIKNVAVTFDEASQGEKMVESPVPPELAGEAEARRAWLLEALADRDDRFMELLLGESEPPEAEIHAAIRRVVLASAAVPVLAGSAFRYKGVQPLLDAVCRYLPCPLDVPPMVGRHPETGKEVVCKPDPQADPAALVFKTRSDRHGELVYLRIYSGTLAESMQLTNPRVNKAERIQGLSLMHADKAEKIKQATAGSIVAVRGLRFTVTGDTLCARQRPVVLERMHFPETVLSMSIEPRTTADREKLEGVLDKMAKDDPTFRHKVDQETGQLIVSGMGELHLEVLKNRMLRDFNVDCVVGKPRVSYKETIRQMAEAEGRYDRKVGEKEQFAALKLRVVPSFKQEIDFFDRLPLEHPLPKHYRKVVAESAVASAQSGAVAGYPMVRVQVQLLDADYRPDLAADAAWAAVASHALHDAVARAGGVLLEPIMSLEVEVPEDALGDVIGDLQARRAEIANIQPQGANKIISARAPISTLFGYATQVRSLTQGRGTYSMEPLDYAEVPEEVAKKHLF